MCTIDLLCLFLSGIPALPEPANNLSVDEQMAVRESHQKINGVYYESLNTIYQFDDSLGAKDYALLFDKNVTEYGVGYPIYSLARMNPIERYSSVVDFVCVRGIHMRNIQIQVLATTYRETRDRALFYDHQNASLQKELKDLQEVSVVHESVQTIVGPNNLALPAPSKNFEYRQLVDTETARQMAQLEHDKQQLALQHAVAQKSLTEQLARERAVAEAAIQQQFQAQCAELQNQMAQMQREKSEMELQKASLISMHQALGEQLQMVQKEKESLLAASGAAMPPLAFSSRSAGGGEVQSSDESDSMPVDTYLGTNPESLTLPEDAEIKQHLDIIPQNEAQIRVVQGQISSLGEFKSLDDAKKTQYQQWESDIARITGIIFNRYSRIVQRVKELNGDHGVALFYEKKAQEYAPAAAEAASTLV